MNKACLDYICRTPWILFVHLLSFNLSDYRLWSLVLWIGDWHYFGLLGNLMDSWDWFLNNFFKCPFSPWIILMNMVLFKNWFGIFEHVFMASWMNEIWWESLWSLFYGLVAHALLFGYLLREMLEVVCVLCVDKALEYFAICYVLHKCSFVKMYFGDSG